MTDSPTPPNDEAKNTPDAQAKFPSRGRSDQPTSDIDSYRRLMESLRTTLPASALLFSFLLVLPFNTRWDVVSSWYLTTYWIAFLSAGFSTAILIGPGIYEIRRMSRSGQLGASRSLNIAFARTEMVGSWLLIVAMIASAILVSEILPPSKWLILITVTGFATVIALSWYIIPARAERRDKALGDKQDR